MSYLFAAVLGMIGYISNLEGSSKKSDSRGYKNNNLKVLFSDYRNQDLKIYKSNKIQAILMV